MAAGTSSHNRPLTRKNTNVQTASVFPDGPMMPRDTTVTRLDPRIRALAETLWNYHRLNQTLRRADAILVLCSHDTVVAERGAQLFLDGWAPLLIFAGGQGAITKALWQEPEAEIFARIAVRLGVP